MITLQESIEMHQVYFKNIFGKKFSLLTSFIYHLIIFILMCMLLGSCTPEEQNCDAELQELDKLQEQGFKNCNGSTTCIYKMTADYEAEKKRILNNCR